MAQRIIPAAAPEDGQLECRESQEWTYGLDNTGTSFADTAEYLITLSDGSTLTFSQTPTAGWTPQMEQWGANIQAAADAAGVLWFVDTRFRWASNPADLSGGGGFPGPPNLAISNALGNMFWRYVNIQICPGQPTPVDMEYISSDQGRSGKLTTDGPVLGPVQKFEVCKVKEDKPEDDVELIWFIYDDDAEGGLRLALPGELPNCWEPCGTLSQIDGPPDRSCIFEFDTACDNNNSDVQADFTNLVTRRVTYCAGEKVAVDYYVPDPADPQALIEYTLVGEYVDCDTGELIPLPVPPCEDFVCCDFWSVENKTPGFFNREWTNLGPSNPFTSDPAEPEAFVDAFDATATPDTDTIATSNVFALNDADNTPNVLDYQRRDGFICLTEPVTLEFGATSEGYIGFWVGECCGEQKRLISYAKAVGDLRTPRVTIPAGIHSIRIDNLDWGGTSSSWRPYIVNGLNSELDLDFFDPFASLTKPFYQCHKAKVCKDTGAIIDILSGLVLDPDNLLACVADCSASSGGDLDQAMLDKLCEIADSLTIDKPDGPELNMRCESYASVLSSGYRNWTDSDDNADLADEFGITPTDPAQIWLRITEFKCAGAAQPSEGQVLGPYAVNAAGTGYAAMQADLASATAGTCLSVSPATGGGSNGSPGFIYEYDDTQTATLVVQEGFTVGGGVQWATSAQGFVVRNGQAGDFIESTGNGATTNFDATADAGDLPSYTDAESCEAI